jgi:hypothetical protein
MRRIIVSMLVASVAALVAMSTKNATADDVIVGPAVLTQSADLMPQVVSAPAAVSGQVPVQTVGWRAYRRGYYGGYAYPYGAYYGGYTPYTTYYGGYYPYRAYPYRAYYRPYYYRGWW